jgi:hypothetical protein
MRDIVRLHATSAGPNEKNGERACRPLPLWARPARRGEDVERNQGRRKHRDAAGCVHRRRIDPPLQRTEVEPIIAVDHQLAVHDIAALKLLGQPAATSGT